MKKNLKKTFQNVKMPPKKSLKTKKKTYIVTHWHATLKSFYNSNCVIWDCTFLNIRIKNSFTMNFHLLNNKYKELIQFK